MEDIHHKRTKNTDNKPTISIINNDDNRQYFSPTLGTQGIFFTLEIATLLRTPQCSSIPMFSSRKLETKTLEFIFNHGRH